MARVFVFPENHKYHGKSVLLMNRYRFVDGVMLEEDDDRAKMMTSNLVDFYGCKSYDHEKYMEMKSAPKSPAKEPPKAAAQT